MDFQTIETLAGYGFDFARTDQGMTRSNMNGWQELATNDPAMLREWYEQGYSFTSVAKRGRGFAIDIDDPEACEAHGLKLEWLEGYFAVNTPSGGRHYHGLQDEATADLKGIVDVYKVKGDKTSGKILELKLDKCSVAAPTVSRFGQPGKRDGIYRPVKPVNGRPKTGLHPDLKAWIIAHAESTERQVTHSGFSGFHPSFDLDTFLEEQDSSEYASDDVDGAFHVVVNECPHCGKPAKQTTVRGGVTKFIFGGNSYGFICHACGINTKSEHEEKMLEKNSDYESWDNYFIYESDDDDLLAAKWNIEDTPEKPQNAEAEETCAKKKCLNVDGYTFEPQDTGNGERLVRKFGEYIRWMAETNEWMVWGENGWRKDTTGTLMRMSKEVVNELVAEAKASLANVVSAKGEMDDTAVKAAKASLKHAKDSGRLERRKAMITSAGYEKGIHTNISDWDADIWLLNVKNGVINLSTQTFRERTKEDLCMKQSPVVYDADATCPLFEAAMAKWSMDDSTWVTYIKQLAGISLSGDVSLQVLPFCQGGGSNGKDTFFSVMRHILGTYCQDVPFQTFAETKNHSEHRNDLASLAGAVRMITMAESTDGHTLDEGIIKLVTGGPDSKVTCRHIYGKPFSYTPQFKPWLMSNYEPVIKGGDWGVWRRVKKIPWDYTVSEAEKDLDFGEKLKVEASGILNWALRGLKDLLANNKRLPACQRCEEATAQYRKDMDIIGRFVRECVALKPLRTTAKAVYKAYSGWCKENGNFPINSRRFHTEFKKRVGSKAHPVDANTGLVYEGLVLKVNDSGMELEVVD